MDAPLEIVFDNMDPSDAVRTRIEAEAAKLEQFYPRLLRCRVVVEAPHRHHHKGKLYEVRIHLSLPGHTEIEANRHPSGKHSHEDIYVAVRDSFAAAQRQLKSLAAKRQGQVKRHENPPEP